MFTSITSVRSNDAVACHTEAMEIEDDLDNVFRALVNELPLDERGEFVREVNASLCLHPTSCQRLQAAEEVFGLWN